MHDAELNFGLGINGFYRVRQPLQPVHTGDQNILEAAVLQLREHREPELGALVPLDPDAENILDTVYINAYGKLCRLVDHTALVTYLHPDSVEEHDGIDLIKRPVLPIFHLGQYLIGHR